MQRDMQREMMRAAGLDMGSDGSSRRRAGSCPPEGRIHSDTGNMFGPSQTMRRLGGLGGLGSSLSGNSALGSQLSAAGPSSIAARVVRTDGTSSSLDTNNSNVPAAPGTLQLTVLVPVLLAAPRRTEADVADIGSTWTKGSASEDEDISLQHGGRCDSCRICMRSFQDGEKLTALPCAAGCCPSIWHESCVRKWLCQGDAPTCPLCRTLMEIPGSAGKASNGSAVAVEVRATLPLSTAMVMAANSTAAGAAGRNVDANAGNVSDSFRGLGTTALNQLLRQLGQDIIQDILLLTLSQRSSLGFGTLAAGNLQPMNVLPFFSNFPDFSSQVAPAAGTRGSPDPATSTALADLGGLLLRSLHSNGNLPVTITAVETRAACDNAAPGADRGNPENADSNGRRRSGIGNHGGNRRHWRQRGGGKAARRRAAEEAMPSDRQQSWQRESWQHDRCRQRESWQDREDRSKNRHWTAKDSSFVGLADSGSRARDQAVLPGQDPKQWKWVPVGSKGSPTSHASSSNTRWAPVGSEDSPASHANSSDTRWVPIGSRESHISHASSSDSWWAPVGRRDLPVSHASSSSTATPVQAIPWRPDSSSAKTWGSQERNGQVRTRRRGGGRHTKTWNMPAKTWGTEAQRKVRWQRVSDR